MRQHYQTPEEICREFHARVDKARDLMIELLADFRPLDLGPDIAAQAVMVMVEMDMLHAAAMRCGNLRGGPVTLEEIARKAGIWPPAPPDFMGRLLQDARKTDEDPASSARDVTNSDEGPGAPDFEGDQFIEENPEDQDKP